MSVLYRLAADAVVIVHFAYVAFVAVGLLAILLGLACRWRWARNFWFRSLHLSAILVVAAEAVCGITCPLTTWEQQLRTQAGEAFYRGDNHRVPAQVQGRWYPDAAVLGLVVTPVSVAGSLSSTAAA